MIEKQNNNKTTNKHMFKQLIKIYIQEMWLLQKQKNSTVVFSRLLSLE